MQPIPETSPRFSNLQLELLRLYSRDVPDEELRDIESANAWWDANNFTDADVDRMLNTKMRAGRPDVDATLRH